MDIDDELNNGEIVINENNKSAYYTKFYHRGFLHAFLQTKKIALLKPEKTLKTLKTYQHITRQNSSFIKNNNIAFMIF